MKGLAGTTWPWNVVPDFQYDEDVIEAAVSDIILTAIGERKMNTGYGSGIMKSVFENRGILLAALITREITVALRYHLPAINVLNVDVQEGTDDNDPVDVVVDYVYQGAHQRVNVPIERG